MERKTFSTRKEIGMEAAALVENSRTVDELESYFKAYTDLPREVVLKHDLLRDGHSFATMAHSREFTSTSVICVRWVDGLKRKNRRSTARKGSSTRNSAFLLRLPRLW
jgi:hypothetical protein